MGVLGRKGLLRGKALAASAGALAALAVAEAAARLLPVEQALLKPLLYYQAADLPVHRPSDDPELVFELRPGARAELDGRKISVNSLGYRDPERSPQKPAGTLRIFCFGGSIVYGLAVGDDDTFPRQLERFLNERLAAPVEVWNAGVPASVLAQDVAQARRALELYEPDVLLFHYSNVGRRAFLANQPFAPQLRRNPALYYEHLRFVPFGNSRPGRFLFERSAAWRALTVALNRFPPAPHNNPAYVPSPRDDANQRAFLEFFSSRRGGPPVFMVPHVKRLRDLAPFQAAGVPLIRLFAPENLPPGAGPEYTLVHPPPHVYAWYARIIGRELIKRVPLPAKRAA